MPRPRAAGPASLPTLLPALRSRPAEQDLPGWRWQRRQWEAAHAMTVEALWRAEREQARAAGLDALNGCYAPGRLVELDEPDPRAMCQHG